MLSSLALMGVGDMHRMNALKTVLAGCINGVSVLVFCVGWKGELAIRRADGCRRHRRQLPETRMAPARAAARVRWVVIVIGFGLAAYYFLR
jgi:hypothetical protein